jgi:hypothetical protein
MDLPIWAGELPFRLTAVAPVADPQLRGDYQPPGYIVNYRRGTVE